jgi:hypothetical protein
MDSIDELVAIWKASGNLMSFETQTMEWLFRWMQHQVAGVFARLDQAVVWQKQAEGWRVDSHRDERVIQFLFGPVTIAHTRMVAPDGHASYPLDSLLKLRKRMRYSPNVAYEVAALARRMTCRQVVQTLKHWTQVQMSPPTVMRCVRAVGAAQEGQDEARVRRGADDRQLRRAPAFLFLEADGTLIHGTKKRQLIEIQHFILYEGWAENGKRRWIQRPYACLTHRGSETLWVQAEAILQERYRLKQTQVVGNSDGGSGYDAEHFRLACYGTDRKVLVQLDAFHVAQALRRALHGAKAWISRVQTAIRKKDKDRVVALLDTYESRLKEPDAKRRKRRLDQVEKLKGYLTGNWKRLFDWREKLKTGGRELPAHAGRLGAMESNQRCITYRMKHRGMHWGPSTEGMVKVIQGLRNGTLKAAYLASFTPSRREERQFKRAVRTASLFASPTRPSIGTHRGAIGRHASASSAIGRLKQYIDL